MKTALLHYWLTNMRGGENVFAEIAKMFSDADIFTHAYNQELMSPYFGKHRIHETFIAKLPGARKKCQRYLPLMPEALRRLDLSSYELIISSESGPIKGIRKPDGAIHICYCHTPMRYLWDMYDDYYRSAGLAGKAAMLLFRDYLRKYDLASAENVDFFAANSRFIADRIRRIYHRESEVVYPPVDTAYFSAGNRSEQDFFLLAGQLVSYKHPELAVLACTRMKKRLIVAGTGPMLPELKKIAGPTIEFSGRVSKEELRKYYTETRALLFPGIEDFGIVPLEAQAAGTPVIAFGAGGVLETILPEKTGLFFESPTVDALINAVKRFEKMNFSVSDCRDNAARFSADKFVCRFSGLVKETIAGYKN